jgi:hypothetical protein
MDSKDYLKQMVTSIINNDMDAAKEAHHNALQIKMKNLVSPSVDEADIAIDDSELSDEDLNLSGDE